MSHTEPLEPGGTVFRERYGLRDLYNLGRYFCRKNCAFPPSDEELLRALERNFNGVPRGEFKVIVSAFFRAVVRASGVNPAVVDAQARTKLLACHHRSVIDVLREALADVAVDERKMNETMVRYQLLLDDTADDSAARLLFQCGVLDRARTIVYDLSDFPGDQNDVVRSLLVSNIKHAMAAGQTVLLMHTAPIHGSLYDLLNQHFSSMQRDDTVTFYANVAVGSYSQPCPVRACFWRCQYAVLVLMLPCSLARLSLSGAPQVPSHCAPAHHRDRAAALLQPV